MEFFRAQGFQPSKYSLSHTKGKKIGSYIPLQYFENDTTRMHSEDS
jgi:hypothetical protein